MVYYDPTPAPPPTVAIRRDLIEQWLRNVGMLRAERLDTARERAEERPAGQDER
jgi:hypothetical protein